MAVVFVASPHPSLGIISDPAREVYKQRAATAEWANAQVCQHGVSQFRVRGVGKVTAVMLLVVLAHNLLRWVALGT